MSTLSSSQTPPAPIVAARATLLPAFAGSDLPASVRDLLASGGRAVLLGESRAEYVARSMSAERRARETPEAFRELVGEIRAAAPHPVLVMVDHELGGIQRCEHLVGALPSAAEARAVGSRELEDRCEVVARELRALGVDVVLGPILDHAVPSPWLSGRLADGDLVDVARVGAAFTRGFERGGVAVSPKHFPGHRGLVTDPMVMSDALVPATRDEIDADLGPFRAVIDAGASCVMVGPGTFPALDPGRPALGSSAVIELLRDGCGFRGVVVSDDVDAAAVLGGRTVLAAATEALTAGVDLVLVSAENPLQDLSAQLAASVPEGRLRDAAARTESLAGVRR